MAQSEQQNILRSKNELIIRQTRRIELLEKRLMAVRKEYYRLKYSDVSSQLENLRISPSRSWILSESYLSGFLRFNKPKVRKSDFFFSHRIGSYF